MSPLTPPAITVITGNLEKRNAITHHVHAHTTHGRIQQIEVPPAVRKLLNACRKRIHATKARLTGRFSAEEQIAISRWPGTVAAVFPNAPQSGKD